MERLARLVFRRRKTVIGLWLVLTIFGAYSAARVSNRWLEQFSIPGYSAYEANQRMLHTFGSGEQFALVGVITAPDRDVTKVPGVGRPGGEAGGGHPGGGGRG
jgi:predicted RND superfamily exporter protein